MDKAADDAAKAVTGADRPGKVLLVTHEVDLEDRITLKDVVVMQGDAPA